MAINTDLDVCLRIVIVQIESHQAAFIGGRDFLSEPFVDDEPLPLDFLSRVGLNVQAIKEDCKRTYVKWSDERLEEILWYIANICCSRMSDSLPQHLVIVFPEYSIPFDQLKILRDFVENYAHLAPVVFGGTHTLPVREKTTNDDVDRVIKRYTGSDMDEGELGFPTRDVFDAYFAPLPTRAVMPVFYSDHSIHAWPVKARLLLKRVLSPFELTNMGKHQFEPEKVSGRMALELP